MISIIATIVNFAGVVLFSTPHISILFNLAHKVQPLSEVSQAEKQLYRGGAITDNDIGFDLLVKALRSGSRPFYRTGGNTIFDDLSAQFNMPGGEVEIRNTDFNIRAISKKDDKSLNEADFVIWLTARENTSLNNYFTSLDDSEEPTFWTEIPEGRFPEMIDEYKISIFHNIGVSVTLIGVVLQAIGALT